MSEDYEEQFEEDDDDYSFGDDGVEIDNMLAQADLLIHKTASETESNENAAAEPTPRNPNVVDVALKTHTSSSGSLSKCSTNSRTSKVSFRKDNIKTVRTVKKNQINAFGISCNSKQLKNTVFEKAVLNAMRKSNGTTDTLQTQKMSKERIEGLAKPKDSKTSRKHASDEDRKHCRFAPKKSKAQKAAMKNSECGYDFVQDQEEKSSTQNFMARMEAAERQRKKKLEYVRGEEEYETRQNKKECPKCGMKQSYAEYRDKKKRCTMCGVEFRIAQAWGDVGSNFFLRVEEKKKKNDEKKQKIREDVLQEEKNIKTIKKSSRQEYYQKSLGGKPNGEAFIDRMKKDEIKRQEKLRGSDDTEEVYSSNGISFDPPTTSWKNIISK